MVEFHCGGALQFDVIVILGGTVVAQRGQKAEILRRTNPCAFISQYRLSSPQLANLFEIAVSLPSGWIRARGKIERTEKI
jgi:hypothetical protein